MIIRPPDVRETHVQVVLDAEVIAVDGVPIPVGGRVLAYLPTGETWAYGDRVRVWGLLQTPPVQRIFRTRITSPARESTATCRIPQPKSSSAATATACSGAVPLSSKPVWT